MAKSLIDQWLTTMVQRKGSDLYLTYGAKPSLRDDSGLFAVDDRLLDDAALAAIMEDLAAPHLLKEFETECELNMAKDLEGVGRFRINAFKQRQHTGLVIRRITTRIPTIEELKLPVMLGELCCEKRGLVIVVGGTGSGKSTSLAAMIDYRNKKDSGHIITIEDPIEYVHEHQKCIVTQREVGVDTHSFEAALKNALRQKPDVILVGEIRDAHIMEQALNIAETGHLALATLHANNANQAIERIVNFFDREMHNQILLNLSLNLRGILSQRLVRTKTGGRAAALEILLNQGLIKELIRKGDIKEIKPVMAENAEQGMQTFDQALIKLWREGQIDEEVAQAEADNPSDMKLKLQQEKIGSTSQGLKNVDTSKLSF
ncbi:MAG: PilT/PilU family type 4a pilus ATPase [Alphaproteobacteria bacterium]|nr:PilT/PilU family type 4a pilus ATPase [Alphaproteobacteria bacterium]